MLLAMGDGTSGGGAGGWLRRAGHSLKGFPCFDEDFLEGAGVGHMEYDPSHAHLEACSDFEELDPDGSARGARHFSTGQRGGAQTVYEYVGHAGEPEAQLIGPHGVGTGAVGEQVKLLFLDPVLHVAPGAVELLVEGVGSCIVLG